MTGKTLRESLPTGSARNKIEFLADEVESLKGVKLPLVEQLPPATEENAGTVLGLTESAEMKPDFRVEYVLQSENIVVASSVNTDEIAVSENHGQSFVYKTLPTPHIAPINYNGQGKLIRMGVHPSSNGVPLLVYATKSKDKAIYITKDLGDTWENLTEKLIDVNAVSPAGATFNALSSNNNTDYQFSVSVDGDLIAVVSRSLSGYGGIAFSTDGGKSFKGHRGSNPDNPESESVLTWKLSIYDVYDLCVCDNGVEKFGFLNAPLGYKLTFGSSISFQYVDISMKMHGYFGMGVDPVRNDIYLFNRHSPKSYLRYSKASNSFSEHTIPTVSYPSGYHSHWTFGHSAKDGGGQISIYDGKMVIGRQTASNNIGIYLFDATNQTAKHLHDVTINYPSRHLLEFTGQASIAGEHILFIQNSQLYKASDGQTMNGPNPKSLNVVMSFNGQWSRL